MYSIPGISTAALTAAILTRNFNKKLKDYEDKFDVLNNKLDEFKMSMENVEKLIKENDDD